MTNLDEFFSDDETRNVETLVAVTKKFFVFVSQLAEIVDSLEVKNANILARLDSLEKLSQNAVQAPSQVSAPPVSPPPVTIPSSVPTQAPSPPAAPPSAPTSLPTPPSFPTPPAPMEAQSAPSPPVTAASSPPPQQQTFSPSNLPALPGNTPAPSQPAPSQPGLSPPGPTGGQVGGTRPPGSAPSPSPMSLKAQMNMELKEAFSRIRKGWDDEK